MKAAKTLIGAICLTSLCLSGFSPAFGQAAPSHLELPGKKTKLEHAAAKARLVVVATLEDLGLTFPTAAGMATFNEAKFKTTRVLKGNLTKSEFTVRLVVLGIGDEQESIPKEGQDYILFINEDEPDKRSRAFKVLPADQQNLAAVATALSAQPKK